jgi:hypothetical protein
MKLEDGQLIVVKPEIGQEMLAMQFAKQRKINEAHIKNLRTMQRLEKWRDDELITFIQYPDGKLQLVDGQHRIIASVREERSFRFRIRIIKVKTNEEAASIYANFNRVEKRRSMEDQLRAYDRDESGVDLTKACAALRIIANDFLQTGRAEPLLDDEQLLEFFDDHLFGLHEVEHRIIKGCPQNSFLRRAAVHAVAAYTINYSHQANFYDEAIDFWHSVAYSTGELNTPSWALYTHFNKIKDKTKGDLDSRRQLIRSCAIAWNKRVDGGDLKVIKQGQMKKFTLLGTPFSKGIPVEDLMDEEDGEDN